MHSVTIFHPKSLKIKNNSEYKYILSPLYKRFPPSNFIFPPISPKNTYIHPWYYTAFRYITVFQFFIAVRSNALLLEAHRSRKPQVAVLRVFSLPLLFPRNRITTPSNPAVNFLAAERASRRFQRNNECPRSIKPLIPV